MHKESPPTVAVIIPVFNRKALCERAVRSVLRQKFRNLECIIVDDGSDGAERILDVFEDARVHIIASPGNYGVAHARNSGARATTAPYLSFLDSDDEWFPEKLTYQINFFRQNPECKIVQCREMWIRNGVRVNPPFTHEKSGGDIFPPSLERCMITPSSVMLTRELFFDTGMFNESFPACEDYDLWLRIAAHHTIGLIDKHHLKRYGGHADQLSSSVPMLDRFRIRSMIQLLSHTPLTDTQTSLVKHCLVQKSTIVANGFKKRGNELEYQHYATIAAAYA